MHCSKLIHSSILLAALSLPAYAEATSSASQSVVSREYRIDAGDRWSDYEQQATYYVRESQGRIHIVHDRSACEKSPTHLLTQSVCVVPIDDRSNEGSVRRTGNRWIMELPSADFFGHELGHVLGLQDLYDPAVGVASRRSGSMMAWVDGRARPLSLYSLRALGWSLVREDNPTVEHFALFLGDQYRWCHQGQCYSLGFHHRPTEPTQPEQWIFEGEWTQHNPKDQSLQALSRLQARYLAYEAERGLWQIPEALVERNRDAWIEWFFVPDPVPRVLITKRTTDAPWPATASTGATQAYASDPLERITLPERKMPATGLDRWRLPLAVAGGSVLVVLVWRLVRRGRVRDAD